jgi:hypothetical protein
MTLATTANRVEYAGNDATLTFAFAFTCWAATEVLVYLRVNATGAETLKTLTTHYTLSPTSYPATGNVVMLTAPATGETLVIIRSQALTQTVDLISGDNLPATTLEQRLDQMVGMIQQLNERLDRSSQFPISSPLDSIAFPDFLAANAGDYLKVNATADGWTLAADVLSTTVTVSAYIETLLDDANASAAQTTLGISAFIKTLLDDADAGTAQTTLGISAFVKTILDDADASAVRTTLGLGSVALFVADAQGDLAYADNTRKIRTAAVMARIAFTK